MGSHEHISVSIAPIDAELSGCVPESLRQSGWRVLTVVPGLAFEQDESGRLGGVVNMGLQRLEEEPECGHTDAVILDFPKTQEN